MLFRQNPAKTVISLSCELCETLLKGQCHEIFESWFFHQKAPPGPFGCTLRQFHFLPKIHRGIEQKVGGV